MILSVLLIKEHYEEKTLWVAQCIEYDVAAQGATIKEAKAAFGIAFSSQLAVYASEGQNSLAMIPSAPPRYWNMFYKAVFYKAVFYKAENLSEYVVLRFAYIYE